MVSISRENNRMKDLHQTDNNHFLSQKIINKLAFRWKNNLKDNLLPIYKLSFHISARRIAIKWHVFDDENLRRR